MTLKIGLKMPFLQGFGHLLSLKTLHVALMHYKKCIKCLMIYT